MATAKIIIKAQDQTKQGINSAKSNLESLNEVASSLGINLKSLTSTGVVVAGLTALAKGAKASCEAFLKTENTYLILKSALGNTKEYNKAIKAIDELSKTTLSSKEDVAKLYAELAQLGKSDTEINKIIEASINLSNVTGKSLTESFNVMLDSLSGNVGTLQKYLPEVKNLTKAELELGEAVDIVNEAFSGTSKDISLESYSQQIKNLKDELQGLGEDIGNTLLNSTGSLITNLQKFVGWADEGWSELSRLSNYYNTTEGTTYLKALQRNQWGDFEDFFKNGTASDEEVLNILYLTQALDLSNTQEKEFYDKVLSILNDAGYDLDKIVQNAISEKNAVATTIPTTDVDETSEIWKNTGYNGLVNRYRLTKLYDDYNPYDTHTSYKWNDTAKTDWQTLLNNKESRYSGKSEDIQTVMKLQDVLSDAVDELSFATSYGVNFWKTTQKSNRESVKTGVEQRIEELNTTITEATSQLSELKESWGSAVESSISSFSSYLSDSDEELWNSYNNEQNLEVLKNQYEALELLVGGDDTRVKLLEDIIYNLENGIDVSLPSSIRSILSSNTKYLSDNTKKEYEITSLESSIDELKTTWEDALKQVEHGNGEYSELEIRMMEEIISGQEKELEALKNVVSTNYEGMDWSNIGDSFDSFFDKFSSESIDSSLLGSLSGALSDLFDAIEPLISVILSSNPIIAFLIQIVKEMAEILSPFLSDTIKPFTDLIHNLAESLSGWIVPILNVIKGVLSGVCDILEMVFIPILEMITPLIEGICGILQILKPVMEWLKNCFIDISTVFTFVADAIKYAIWSFLNWLDSINIWGWTPFAGAGGYDVSTLSSYDSRTGGLNIANTKKALQEKYTYDVTDWTATNGEDTSTSTSVSTASYTGANNYYFNIYQQAPVVGDGGMQEFAKMIKSEFAELAYMSA